MKHIIAGILAIVGVYALVPTAGAGDFRALEKRGCCSHHKGVCGCEGGRTKCCDGTLSPSCEC